MKKIIIICFCVFFLVVILSLCRYIDLKIQEDSKNKNNLPIQDSPKSQIGFEIEILDENELRKLIGAENSNYKIINTRFINSKDFESTEIFVELSVPKTLLDKLQFDSDFQVTPVYEQSMLEFGLDMNTIQDIGMNFKQHVVEVNGYTTSYRPYYVWWMMAKETSKSGANVYVYTSVADKFSIDEKLFKNTGDD
jgi:hypothetical protein